MKKFSEKFVQKNEKEEYKFLKEDLLNGLMSPEKLKNKLFELDQSAISRDASEKNLKFLYDPAIIKFINHHHEYINEYQKILGFTEFHIAQRLISRDSQEALEHFKNALENIKTEKSNESFGAYIEGTILYIKGEEIPEDVIKKVKELRNVEILRNFNAGLKKRGYSLYEDDYKK